MKNLKTNLLFFFIFLLAIILSYSFAKEAHDIVPDTYINIKINMNNHLIGLNQSKIFTNTMVNVTSLGYNNNGIIVYMANQNEYYAYDRTCTYHVEESIPVDLDINTMFAICPVCSSKYQLFWSGIPTDAGPSNFPLKQYKAVFNPNISELNIFNF